MGYPIDGLGDHAHHRLAIGPDEVRTRRLSAIHDFAVDEFALQIGGDEVYAADVASIAHGICEETTLENYWQIY